MTCEAYADADTDEEVRSQLIPVSDVTLQLQRRAEAAGELAGHGRDARGDHELAFMVELPALGCVANHNPHPSTNPYPNPNPTPNPKSKSVFWPILILTLTPSARLSQPFPKLLGGLRCRPAAVRKLSAWVSLHLV